MRKLKICAAGAQALCVTVPHSALFFASNVRSKDNAWEECICPDPVISRYCILNPFAWQQSNPVWPIFFPKGISCDVFFPQPLISPWSSTIWTFRAASGKEEFAHSGSAKKPLLSYKATETVTTCTSEDSIFSIFQNKVSSFTLSEAHWILSLPLSFSAMSALFCLEKSFSWPSTPCNCSISSKFPLHIITACLRLFCLLDSSAYFLLVLMLPFTFPDTLIPVSFEGLTYSTMTAAGILRPLSRPF